MRLSIIVPVYNMMGEGKLEYCINSLLNQNLPKEDYEIICVDDASTDDSLSLLRKFEKDNPGRIRVVSYPDNRRQGGARNAGIKEAFRDISALPEFIGFMDADDFAHPDMFFFLLRKADDTGADCVGCQYNLTGEHSLKVGKVINVNTPEQTGTATKETRKNLMRRPGSMVIKIYKSEVIRENNLWFPEHTFYEDNAAAPLWMMCFSHFELVDKPLYYYFQNDESTVHVVNMNRLRDRMRMGTLFMDEAAAKGYADLYADEVESHFTLTYYVNTLFSYVQTSKKLKLPFLRELASEMKARVPEFRKNPYYTEITNPEQRKLIDKHMRNVFLFALYYRALRTYRNLMFHKSK